MTSGWMVVVALLGWQPAMPGDDGAKLQLGDSRDGAPAAVEVRN